TLAAVAAALTLSAVRVGARALNLPGTIDSYASTPDTAANSVAGDIDLRVLLAPDSWTGIQALLTKDAGSSNVDYGLLLVGDKLQFVVNVNGASTPQQILGSISTVGTGFAPGSKHWVRATRSASAGDVKFYT